ncbi:MAG: DUF134 domain-containing protein [Candidatus ainarchaeum sp.]|nr:DUF134 domain-containing protein [Candidatus ainarchaeum sp.]
MCPRPTMMRKIIFDSDVTYFKPAGIPLHNLEEIKITFEEVESLRLKDVENLNQEDCSKKMGISQPTFFRILNSARKKISEAIVKGKAIRIEGGNFKR